MMTTDCMMTFYMKGENCWKMVAEAAVLPS